MKWIVGPDAVSTCASVAAKFKAKCLSSFNQEFQANLPEYRSWMSSPHFRKVKSLWMDAQKAGILVHDTSYLQNLKSAIDDSQLPVIALSDEAKVLQVFDDISKKRPDSYAVFQSALELLTQKGGWVGKLYPQVVDEVIPVVGTWYVESSNSCTSHHLIGSPFHAIPIPLTMSPAFDLAVSYAHELGHQILSIYQRSDRIIKSDLLTPVFSGVRGTTRPAIQAFHAALASAYMVEVSRNLIKHLQGVERSYALEVLEIKYEEFLPTLNSLKENVEFTELGRKMFEEMLELVA